MKKYKSDQLVIPFPLPEGMALRAVAETLEMSTASLLRFLIRRGLENAEDIQTIYEKELAITETIPILTLLQAKSNQPQQNNKSQEKPQ